MRLVRKPRSSAFGIGMSSPRIEDGRFLTGAGQFVDDLVAPGAAFAVFVRSPHAHARIKAVRTGNAETRPGVLAVFTGAHWQADGKGALACMHSVTSTDGSAMNEVERPVLVGDYARHVGDPLALVVAESHSLALDAAELVELDVEALPAAVDLETAVTDQAPLVHTSFATNVAYDWSRGDERKVNAALASAAHVVSVELVNNRVHGFTMEPRAVLGQYHAGDDSYTLWSTTQMPHVIRDCLAQSSLRVPAHRIRVVAPDVGGGFGLKGCHYAEEAAVLWAAKRTGCAVRWTCARSESFIADVHARDQVVRAKLAFDENGLIQGLWVDTLANLGAYVTLFGPGCPMFGSAVICGPYQVAAAYVRARCVYTNTVPVEAYRGAGLPEATYVMERLMDMGAAAMGLDPLELRVLNVLPNHKTPITNAMGTTYDSGSYAEVAELLRSRYADWREQQSRQSERLIGVGIAGYIGGAGVPSSRHCLEGGSRLSNWEHVRISVHPGGEVTVACGTHSHGQGHETTFRQVVSSKLGCDPGDIEIVYGDTARVHAGLGTYASRSMVLAGAAMSEASDRIVAKGKRLAAHAFECAPADVEFSSGRYRISGTDRELSFQEVASAAWRGDAWPENFEPGLDETCYVDPGGNRSSGFHLCVIEVDKETGAITVLDYLTADDFGRVINPLIVDGQVHGAVTQGLGQALGEWCAYDEDGQLLSGSPMDYQLPRAADLPLFSLTRIETPAPGNPLGIKGMGEAATSPAPPALANALQDALSSNGCEIPDMPFTPCRVWRALQGR